MVTLSQIVEGREKQNSPVCDMIIWDVRKGKMCRSFSGTINSWPAFKWSHDDAFVAILQSGKIYIYETDTFSLLDKKPIIMPVGINDFTWSPTDNIISFWSPETNNTPARYLLPIILFSNSCVLIIVFIIDGLTDMLPELLNLVDFKIIILTTCFINEQPNQNFVVDKGVNLQLFSDYVLSRVALISIPSRKELCTKNLISVAEIQLLWHPQGDFLCVQVLRCNKKKIEDGQVKYLVSYHHIRHF